MAMNDTSMRGVEYARDGGSRWRFGSKFDLFCGCIVKKTDAQENPTIEGADRKIKLFPFSHCARYYS